MLHDKIGNKYDLNKEYGIGWTTNTNKEFYFDVEDFEKIQNYTWFETDNGYVVSDSVNRKRTRLHRLILGLDNVNSKENLVDHINHNKMDNRKNNLRKCTSSQNNMNRTPIGNYTGVKWREDKNKWEARICKDRNVMVLGLFNTMDDAIKARIEAEQKLFKEFSYSNSLEL